MSSTLTAALPVADASAQSAATHLDYRPDIDGLRAVAVLPVVIFHAFPALIPGGFVGVDIFFVISGYLISGIIFRALSRERFSFLEFYSRRAKRIFPALITMLATIAVFGWLVSLPEEYQLLGKHVATGAGFMLNLSLFIDTNPYFGAIGTPLVHLWSLGVEEQFYLLWPVLMWASWRLGKWQLALIVAVLAASFTANVAAVASDPMQSFYLPSSRLWELALGGLLAWAEYGRGEQMVRAAGFWHASPLARLFSPNVRASVAVALLLVSFATFNVKTTFPGWWALLPCLGAFLIIWAGPHSWFNRYVLSHPVMVFVGLISYPLYLWHWPILSFAHTMDWRQFTPVMQTGAVVLSFVLAFATYQFIERPLRSSPKTRKVALGLTTVLVGCAAVGYLGFAQYIPSRAIPDSVAPFVKADAEEYPFPDEDGFFKVGNPAAPKELLFIGDSTLGQYHTRIARVLAERTSGTHHAVFAWRPGCSPDIGTTRVGKIPCQKLLAEAVEYAKRPQVDTVVLGFCWYPYFTANRDADHVGEPRPLVPGVPKSLENVRRMAADFIAQGKRVYIILQAPLDPGYAPLQMVRRNLLAPGFELDVRTPSRDRIEQAFEPFTSRLRQIAADTGALVIDPMNELCDAKSCPAVTANGEPMYRDMFHLRIGYVREQVRFLDETVLSAGKGREVLSIADATDR
jgi:peptidoglycan/LPS O-acetylase OafA/YrhL